jgi:hypothetical protein
LHEDELIVLANSRKYGGRCVAGISRTTGEWIRPISWRNHGELDSTHTKVDGRQVEELDVVKIFHDGSCGNPAQPENVMLVDRDWELVETLGPAEARTMLSDQIRQSGPLFGNRGKAVTAEIAAEGLDSSLALVEPPGDLILRIPEASGNRSPRALFTFDGRPLDMAVTDYKIGPAIRMLGVGDHALADLGLCCDRPVLTVSLAEAKEGWCTKLVAGFLIVPEEG